jgi:hypothetical protein
MKQTVVPAQVTTVEDKIAGNISFKQLLLLVTPVFIGGAMYVFLPPFLGYSSYKVTLWVLLAIICLTMAIRVKGRLVIEWLIVRGKYNLRPSQFVYNKNSMDLRSFDSTNLEQTETEKVVLNQVHIADDINDSQLHKLEQIILEPKADLIFSATKKGGLRVSIKEEAIDALVKIGEKAVPTLIEGVKSKDPYVVILCIDSLKKLGPKAKSAIPELKKIVGPDLMKSILKSIDPQETGKN